MRPAVRLKTALVDVTDVTTDGRALSLAAGYLFTLTAKTFGRRVRCRLFHYCPIDRGSFLAAALADLEGFMSDVVGIPCYVWNMEAVSALARALKRRRPAVRVVLGGPEIVEEREGFLRSRTADCLVFGEGEVAWLELIRRSLGGMDWAGTPGTSVLKARRPCRGPQGRVLERLEVLPSPWLKGIFRGYPKVGTLAVLENARGCPMKCSFCTWAGRRRMCSFPESRVRAEIRHIAALPVDRAFFCDSDFFRDQDRALRLVRLMRTCCADGGPKWILESGYNRLNAEVLEATDHPCFELTVGVESLCPEALRLAGRNPDPGAIKAGLACLAGRATRATILLNLICGLPGETRESFLAGLDAVLAAAGAKALVFCCQALPGSRLARQAEVVKRMRRPPYYVLATKTLPARDLTNLQRTVFQVYMLMSHGETGTRMRELAASGQGSVLAVFHALLGRLDREAHSILRSAWRRFRRLPSPERHFLTLDAAEVLDCREMTLLFAAVRSALGVRD